MENETDHETPDFTNTSRTRILARVRNLAARAVQLEAGFLSLLRYGALLGAAVVLLGSTIYLGLGLIKQIGWTQVAERPVSLTADDLTPPAPEATAKAPETRHGKPTVSTAIRALTLRVYRTRFKGYQRADTKITEQEIVHYVWTDERISAFATLAGSLHDKDGKILPDRDAVMKDALDLVATSSQNGDFAKQLAAPPRAWRMSPIPRGFAS